MKRYKIKFQYADKFSNWEWRDQCCSVCANSKSEAKRECIKIYGLGIDCDYKIVSVEEE